MKREMTIGYQNRRSRGYCGDGTISRDLPASPKLVLANHFMEKISCLFTGDKVMVRYSPGSILIKRLI